MRNPEVDDAISECHCPKCNHKLTHATGVSGADRPTPGDLSLCLNCGTKLVFNRDLTVRWLTDEEFEALPQETKLEIAKAAFAIIMVKSKRKLSD